MWATLVDSLVYFPDRELYGDPADVGLPFTDLAIPTEDGERVHGWWIPTRAAAARGHVLFFHGNAGNISHRARPRAGAHRRRPGRPPPRLPRLRPQQRPSQRGGARALDARAARAALVAGGQVDPARLVYMGESLGGAVALRLALEEPPLACVLQSTFTSLRDVARQHYPAPLSALAGDAYPNRERIRRLDAPVLILHGDVDEIVPVDARAGPVRGRAGAAAVARRARSGAQRPGADDGGVLRDRGGGLAAVTAVDRVIGRAAALLLLVGLALALSAPSLRRRDRVPAHGRVVGRPRQPGGAAGGRGRAATSRRGGGRRRRSRRRARQLLRGTRRPVLLLSLLPSIRCSRCRPGWRSASWAGTC